MIRLFHLRDLALLHRLGERAIPLEAETALTSSSHPVRHALLNMVVSRQINTYVWKSEERDAAAFAQLRWDEGEPSAHLVCLGLESTTGEEVDPLDVDEDVWLPLLDELVAEAGNLGVHSIIAEASETGPELQMLRRAGFAIYTRQDIWISDEAGSGHSENLLHPREPVDDWDILVLYSNIVPALIQSVEPNPPLDCGQNWVLREGSELAAFVHVNSGPVASWMRLLIHPNAHTKPKEIIGAALHVKEPSVDHPVYCSVRRYQSWLQVALEGTGFRLWGSQAVMVKHTVQHERKTAPVRKGVLEPQTVPGSPPLVQGFSQPQGNGHRSR